MSEYTPKEGDRVRVVMEGEVKLAQPDGWIWVRRNGIRMADPHVVSVEKLTDPIPTTVGTVLWIAGHAYQCDGRDSWSITGMISRWTDPQMQEHADRFGFAVLREGKP